MSQEQPTNCCCNTIHTTSNHAQRRGTTRINFQLWNNLNARPADELLYLKISRPHINDIAIVGPFHTVEATYPNIRSNLRESQAGMSIFNELIETGKVDCVEHIIGPFDDNSEKSVMIELIRFYDAEMKASLPCPVWQVCVCELTVPNRQTGFRRSVMMEDMELEKFFLTAEEAEACARSVLNSRLGEYDGGNPFETRYKGDWVGCISKAVDGKQQMHLMVKVSYDSAAMTY